MTRSFTGWKTATSAAAAIALAWASAGWAQSTPQSDPAPASTPPAATQSTAPSDNSSAQPAPGTTPVAGDTQPATQDTKAKKDDKNKKDKNKKDPSQSDPAPGTEPVKGDVAAAAVDPEKVIAPGSQMIKVKAGSIEDVSAVGNRDIGGRGMGNWYSTDTEIKMGKSYASEIERSTKFINDPVVTEYVNRIGQNIVKNSDCKVPFTIKVIDSDEINAMALPGGFFYVNSGLIMAADEEAELAGVMAHETAHVCAHHAAREMTRMNYAQIGSIPLIIFTQGSWTGYGIYEATQLAIPMTFLKFSRMDEAEADWLGVQYMYKSGYDPQAFIQFFEKIDALEKHKPGTLAKVFADHPQTPDRIMHSEEEIATILPSRPDYMVTTSEFDDVKTRLACLENKRKINDGKGGNKPTLRRTTSGNGNNDPNNPNNPASSTDDRPTL